MRPIIGIVLDLLTNDSKNSYSLFPWYALRANYASAVSQAGGLPLFIPFEEECITDTLNLIDGLIIAGGDFDIDPKYYGEEIMSDKVIVSNERTDYEYKICKAALELNIPILGICNGMQLLNVIFGGSLIQDIPLMAPSSINHEQPIPKDEPTHLINILPNTLLAKIVQNGSDSTEFSVNSTHHQAIARLGEGLVICATAPDGIIEAIEAPEYDFVIGVEWHPEYLSTKNLDEAIFKALTQKAQKFKHNKLSLNNDFL